MSAYVDWMGSLPVHRGGGIVMITYLFRGEPADVIGNCLMLGTGVIIVVMVLWFLFGSGCPGCGTPNYGPRDRYDPGPR